jgi:hypothetical protein
MGQLTACDFQSYLSNAIQDEAIKPGPFALDTVSASDVSGSYLNVEYGEVGNKASSVDLLSTLSEVEADLLEDIEPVIIGPAASSACSTDITRSRR